MYFIISLCYKTAVPGVYIMVSISRELSALAVLILSVISDCIPMGWSPAGSSVHGDSPGKKTGVGCHVLLQGIFPSQVYFLWSFTPLGKTFRVKETKRRNVFWWLTQFTSMYGRCIHIWFHEHLLVFPRHPTLGISKKGHPCCLANYNLSSPLCF